MSPPLAEIRNFCLDLLKLVVSKIPDAVKRAADRINVIELFDEKYLADEASIMRDELVEIELPESEEDKKRLLATLLREFLRDTLITELGKKIVEVLVEDQEVQTKFDALLAKVREYHKLKRRARPRQTSRIRQERSSH